MPLMSWLRKYSWVIILIVAILQALSYFGIQAEQWSFLARRFLHLTIFEISVIVLVTALIVYRLAYRSFAKKSGSPLTTEDIKGIKRRIAAMSDYPGKVDDLISQWQSVLDSDAPIESKYLSGMDLHQIKSNCEFRLLFDKTKSYTVTEVEAIARSLPKIKNYVKEIKNTEMSSFFLKSHEEATEYAKRQIRRIVDTLENIKKSISN